MMGIFIKKVGKTINIPLSPFIDACFGRCLNNVNKYEPINLSGKYIIAGPY